MKRLSYLFSLLFLMTFVAFTSCGGSDPDPEPEPTPAEEATALLEGTWTVDEVSRSDNNAVDLAETVTLSFTEDGVYNATGASAMPGDDPTFPSSGNWSFPSETNVSQIIISGSDIDFNAANIQATSLSFTYTTQDAKSDGSDVTITVNASKVQ